MDETEKVLSQGFLRCLSNFKGVGCQRSLEKTKRQVDNGHIGNVTAMDPGFTFPPGENPIRWILYFSKWKEKVNT